MLERLRWFAQAIYQQPSVQIDLFPSFVEVADELALGWEEGIGELQSVKNQLTPAQIKAFEDLDEFMLSISGKDNIRLWTIDTLNTSAEWRLLRNMAGNVLSQMNWPKTPPPPSNDIYVSNRR